MTKFLVFGCHFRPWQLLSLTLIANDSISPSDFARNISVIFDKRMNYEAKVGAICNASFFHLRMISPVKKYLSAESTKTLVHVSITCKLDNCNSLLYGMTQNLIQKVPLVQNCAARLAFNKRKFEHVSPLLIDLPSGSPSKSVLSSKSW